jgi:hypothetical protein
MTTQLHVDIATPSRGAFPEGVQVVGSIYPVGHGGTSHRNVLFPAGSSTKPARFDVTPGRYIVECTLPNSDVLSDEVDVADGQVAVVSLNLAQTSLGSQSWQYLVGNVGPEDDLRRQEMPVPRSATSRYFANAYLEAPGADPKSAEHSLEVGTPGPMSPPKLWRLSAYGEPAVPYTRVIELNGRQGSPPDARRIAEFLQPADLEPAGPASEIDAFTLLYQFGGPDFNRGPASQRQFLIAEAAEEAYLVTLPLPWADMAYNSAVVEVLVNLAQSPNGSPIGVTVHDAAIGAGLAYMAAGALAKAARVFRDVQQMLQEKVSNPLSAAAGGYILIGTDLDNEQRHWDRWLYNLRNWFPWLPDGSILWATRQLRTARSAEELELARAALIEACERGLPVFTLGLSWLVDGLSQFPGDEECAAWLDRVRRASSRTDTRQPFVVLRLGGLR